MIRVVLLLDVGESLEEVQSWDWHHLLQLNTGWLGNDENVDVESITWVNR